MKQKLLFGCGAFLLLIAVAVGTLIIASPYLVKKGKKWFDAQVAESSRLSAIESRWQPPSDNVQASWFPSTAGGWTRGEISTVDSISELDLPRPGVAAVYNNPNGRAVQVTVFTVSEAEKAALVKAASETLISKLGSHTASYLNNHATFTIKGGHTMVSQDNRIHIVAGGDQHARLWWINGWLFLFRSTGSEDPGDFAAEFVSAMPHGLTPEAPELPKTPQ